MQDECKTKERLIVELRELRQRLEQTEDLLAKCRKAEEALHVERDFSSALLETVGAMVVVLDREGRIVRFNQACEIATGYTFAEVENKPFDIFITPEEADGVKAVFHELRSGHLPSWHENHWVTKEGKLRLVAWSNTALFKEGQVEFVIGTGIDVTDRKEAEGYIAHLASFPQLDPAPVMEVDFSGRVTFYNAATLKALERLGLPGRIEALFPEDMKAILEKAQETGKALFQREVRVGDAVFAESISFPVDVKAARIYAWDISKRKQAEEALRQSEEKLRLIAETIQDVFWLSNSRLDQIIYVSPAYEELWGRSRESLYASPRSFLEAVHPEDRERVVATVSKGHSQGIPWNHEYRLIRPDGSCRWVQDRGFPIKDEQGNLRLVTGVATDITERKRAEETLRKSEKDYRNLFSHMLEGFAYCNMHFEQGRPVDFTYLKVNEVFETLTGLKNVTGKKVSECIPGIMETNPELFEIYGRVALTGKPQRFETYLDPLKRWFSISVYSPQKEHFVAVFDDITERKRIEEELRQRTAQLEGANREMEALSHSVFHDLKVPLRAIEGFSRMLVGEHADQLDEEGRRLLKVITDNTKLMHHLIDDLRALDRLGRMHIRKSSIDMATMTRQVFEQLRAKTPERDIRLTVTGLPPAIGDQSLLYQVLGNLLSNAIKYTKPRKTAVLEVGGKDEETETIYYVKDNGVGFDDRYVSNLFRPFHRPHIGEEEYEGTGVGLAIVKRIIERHGGRVWAEGKVDEGATFYFALPKE